MSDADCNWKYGCGVVIYTNLYAGNYERELCAFCTGITGECEVGEKSAKLYHDEYKTDQEELEFEEFIQQVADDHGCRRPVSLFSTERCPEAPWALIIFLWDRPTLAQLNRIKERAKLFAETYENSEGKLEILDIKLLERTVVVTDEEIKLG